MPTSLKATPVSFHNGQKRINLRAALETQQYKTSSVEMTFGEALLGMLIKPVGCQP
jgi:hypothetical protein